MARKNAIRPLASFSSRRPRLSFSRVYPIEPQGGIVNEQAASAHGHPGKRDVRFALIVVFLGISAVTLAQLQAIGAIPVKNLLKNESM